MTKEIGGYSSFIIVIQLNDCIMRCSLNRPDQITKISNNQDMKKIHMIRGINDKLFFAESSETTEVIKCI